MWPFKAKTITVPADRGGWFPWIISEADSGYWQRNIEYKRKDILCYPAVFACISLISSDISKMSIRRVRQGSNGIWVTVNNGELRVLERPNEYQNRIQFIESWVISKLIRGNAYIWKERNNTGNVVGLHVLHPDRVLPLVTDDGQVFYQLSQDNLAGIEEGSVTVPASEIIHDRFNCFYHPLVGLSPLYAAGLPAFMGVKILENSAKLFQNGARPGGVLTIPEAITKERAEAIADAWVEKYSGDNYGRPAVLGGNVKYEPISLKAEETQLVEQLKLTSEMVCSVFHVPAYKVIGNAPAYNNIEALEQSYYSQCLQTLIEAIELSLDEGLEITDGGVEFDLDGLLRMDSKSHIETLGVATTKAIYSPNEARKKLNLPPVDGGDTPFLQEQNYPISELVNRPSKEAAQAPAAVEIDDEPDDEQERVFDFSLALDDFRKALNA